jgi:hypothetical protein
MQRHTDRQTDKQRHELSNLQASRASYIYILYTMWSHSMIRTACDTLVLARRHRPVIFGHRGLRLFSAYTAIRSTGSVRLSLSLSLSLSLV